MNEVKSFIESGILEMYVMGQATAAETADVENMAALHNEVRREIDDISITMERYARAHAVKPSPMVQPFLMATIDYMERMKKGEAPAFPPTLHEGSKIIDYTTWLDRADLYPAEPLTDVHASIIGYTPQLTTAIVWLTYGAPQETHTSELEKFLIVEGTCDIIIGKDIHSMRPGDTMTIPLHIPHSVKVTSDYPCKIILQRAAA